MFSMARKYHDKEWLQEKYWTQGMDTTEIAKEIGVVRETIRRWLVKHNIPRRKRGPEKGSSRGDAGKLRDKDWLENQYNELEKSAGKIARELDLNDQTVLNWMEKHGIERREVGDVFVPRSSGKDKRLDDKEWLQAEYEDNGRSMYDIAQELDVTTPAVKYRLDTYGIERRSDLGPFDGGDKEFQRDPEWGDKRTQRLEIDEYTCQDCGVHQSDYYRGLDIHHLVKKEEFVDDNGDVDWEGANAMSNLISLCQSCHVKRHTQKV